ncbi:MAG TPA: hypothetical protein VEX15_03780 [Nocardioidaceae bacterium]|nr:hypothetical protein [Nocardioidaceae bacterium]
MRLRLPGGRQVDPVLRLHDYARVQRRAGFLDAAALLGDVTQTAAEDVDPESAQRLAREAIAAAEAAYETDQAEWPAITDYDRLQGAFEDLERRGVVVLQAVDDHWAAASLLEQRASGGAPVRGVAWFTAPDVWHAVDNGMLELNVWHGDSANVAPGDVLLDEVIAVLAAHELAGHFDEGRIEISAYWQRRL